MLTMYINVLHAFSSSLKIKASECYKVFTVTKCFYSQVAHVILYEAMLYRYYCNECAQYL